MTHREFEGFDAYARRLAIAKSAGNADWVRLPQTKRVMQDECRKLYFTGQACKRGHISPRNEHGDCTRCHIMRLSERRDG